MYQKTVYGNLAEVLSKIKIMRDRDVFWLAPAKVGDMLGRSRFWVWQKINSGVLKSKIDKTKGIKKKYYIVHIDWLEEFIKDLQNPTPDKFE